MKRGSGVAKLIKEAGRVVKVSLDEREGSGGTFLSGVSEGGVNEILDGEVGVGGVGDDEGIFFPEVSAKRARLGRHDLKSSAVSEAPVRMTPWTSGAVRIRMNQFFPAR